MTPTPVHGSPKSLRPFNSQNFTKVPFVKCFSGVALVPHQVSPPSPFPRPHISHCRHFVKSMFMNPLGLTNMPFVKCPWSTRMAITNSNDMHKVQGWKARLGEKHVCELPKFPPEKFLGPSGPKLETELKMSSQGPKS